MTHYSYDRPDIAERENDKIDAVLELANMPHYAFMLADTIRKIADAVEAATGSDDLEAVAAELEHINAPREIRRLARTWEKTVKMAREG